MSELVLTDNENGLFELMRDGVITDLTRIGFQPNVWRCTVHSASETVVKHFESRISALDAFMNARVYILTEKLEGREVYSWPVRAKRKELGLA